jgi:hypothetical protein
MVRISLTVLMLLVSSRIVSFPSHARASRDTFPLSSQQCNGIGNMTLGILNASVRVAGPLIIIIV